MSLSNLSSCYEGVQRIYRNALVTYIRDRFRSSFGADAEERLRKPFLKEWEGIKEAALERRRTGELASAIVDDFDYLGVNHFYNLFDAYADVLVPTTLSVEKPQRKKDMQALLSWMKTVKNLRDPLSHPSSDDFCYEDAFALLDCARRALKVVGLSDASEKVRTIMSGLAGAPAYAVPDRERLEDRLPPRETIVLDFVGRQRELTKLWEWLRDPHSRRYALAGEGGKGKSALAYNFATQVIVEAPEPYQIVLWLTAKQRRFQEGSVTDVLKPDFTNLDSALDALLLHYGWADEIQAAFEEKRRRALELLNEFPALLVVDDIDSLESEDEAAIEFFTFHAPQTRSKVLLTSRRIVFGMGGSTTHVAGLEFADAGRFIESRSKMLELDLAAFGDPLKREIIHATEGSPLYIEDLLRLSTVMPAADAISAWKEKGGGEARKYALKRELDLLSPSARGILTAACIATEAVTRAHIEAVTGFPDQAVTNGFGELHRLFLVPKPRLIEGEERYEINVNTRSLVRAELGSTELYRRLQQTDKTITGRLPKAGRGEVRAIIRQAVLLVRNRDLVAAESLLLRALAKRVDDPDLTAFLGWVYKAWDPPRVNEARERLRRAWQLKCADEEMYKHWVRMELDEREWTKAVEAAERGLKFVPASVELLSSAGFAYDQLGKELSAGLHADRAAQCFKRAHELLLKARDEVDSTDPSRSQLRRSISRALVLNAEHREDVGGMRKYFRDWSRREPDDSDLESEWDRLSRKHDLGPRS
jgi:hypothetical protein